MASKNSERETRESLIALRWWTEVAPDESFEGWITDLERTGVSRYFARNVDRLYRYTGESNLRVARLGSMVAEAQ